MKTNYTKYNVATNIGLIEVVACDWESAKADVRDAYPDAEIYPASWEVAK
jgi:hypothetical protein